MPKSKIAVFTASQIPIKIEEVEIPPLKPGEILVRNEYTTLCRSDLYTYTGKRIEPSPTILGHEIVGRVVSFGEGHSRIDQRGVQLKENDRISWAIYASDPDDPLSKQGIPQKAGNLFKYGHQKLTASSTLHGGLGEYIILRPGTPVVKITENLLLPVAATLNCAVATIAGALRLAGSPRGKRVLVSGAGMLGLVACAMCKSYGASAVVAMDIEVQRLQTAKRFGATAGILVDVNSESRVESFDIVLELSGVKTAVEQTLQRIGIGGTAVWVGATYPQADASINAERVVRNLWTIRGLHNYNAQDLVTAVEFMEEHHDSFPFSELVFDGFSLDQADEAFQYAIANNPFRVGIRI